MEAYEAKIQGPLQDKDKMLIGGEMADERVRGKPFRLMTRPWGKALRSTASNGRRRQSGCEGCGPGIPFMVPGRSNGTG